ncbi:NEQ285 [Nanoarchaeum equitans Kin4-M]|uniref:NEQ285 n=1 Tax=Nanoarchaeum equitans (strain Kin4-M) TaxID=228908 RepID=Q74MT4_NANEQ|nr:NEQ285 [Nanoarchaeum equitans Kin4-M]
MIPWHAKIYYYITNFLSYLPLPSFLNEKEKEKIKFYAWELGLEIDPNNVGKASLFFILLAMVSAIVSLFNINFIFLTLIFLFLALYVYYYPIIVGKSYRTKKETQFLLFLLNVAMFYEVLPSIDLAIYNSAKHLPFPIKLDIERLLWYTNLRYFESISDALEFYAKRWKENTTITQALFILINKNPKEALSYYLEQSYYRMLSFSRELKSSVEIINMIGIVLPIMTMTLLPVIIGILASEVPYIYLFIFYDIVLPTILLILSKFVIEKKVPPTIFSYNPGKRQYRLLILVPLFFLWLIIFLNASSHYKEYKMFNSIVSLAYTFLLVLFLLIGFALYFIDIYSLYNKIKKMVNQLIIFLETLKSYVSLGYSLERALSLTSKKLQGLEIAELLYNIENKINENKPLDIAVKEALKKYNNPIIETIFDIIIANYNKGLTSLSELLDSLLDYLRKVNAALERTKDLLSEAISEMKMQIIMLIPVMLGIIVGIGNFMISIMLLITNIMKSFDFKSAGQFSIPLDVLQMFMIKKETINPFMYQALVGLYVIASVIILSILLNSIENSKDPISEKIVIVKNLAIAFAIYSIIVIITITLFQGLYEMLKMSLFS